jgi:hypothetical protein
MESGMGKNFLELYGEFCDTTEVPSLFSFWCGVGAISAALGRNSFIQFGQFPVYPNFYILLVAGSALHRKSTSINIAESIIRGVQPLPKLIPGSVTPPALIEELQSLDVSDMTALFRQSGTGFLLCDEFKTFLNRKSYDMGLATLLINLYDCKEKVEYKTMARGKEVVNNGCLSILAGSTPDWLRDGIPPEAIGGGLTSRMLFILYEGESRRVPWPAFGAALQGIKQDLIHRLQLISGISGEFTLTDEAKQLVIDEYNRFWDGPGQVIEADPVMTGYAGRRQNHQLKISMVLSAAERLDRVITRDHIVGATHCLQVIEKTLPSVMKKITASAIGTNIELILTMIKKFSKGRTVPVTRSQLQRAVAHRFGMREMDEILGTLLSSGMVIQRTLGNMITYELGDVSF